MRLVIYSGLIYAEMPGYRPLLLDLHVPDDADDAVGVPVVFWIHGGGFTSGDRRYLPLTMEPGSVFAALTGAGLACATVDYRLAAEAGWRRSATTSPPRSASCAQERGSTAWTRAARHVGGVGRRASGPDGRAD